jgi:hypothetical protein
MEQLNLTHIERGYRANRAYDGYYPSLHLNYNDVTEKLILRGAYARTYGRPNLNDVIPTATVDEADLDADEIGDPSVDPRQHHRPQHRPAAVDGGQLRPLRSSTTLAAAASSAPACF